MAGSGSAIYAGVYGSGVSLRRGRGEGGGNVAIRSSAVSYNERIDLLDIQIDEPHKLHPVEWIPNHTRQR